MKIRVDVDCKTDEMTEEWLLDFSFKLWELQNIGQSARKHFSYRFSQHQLPDTEQHISNLLSGRTRLGDLGWAIVEADAGQIAVATRKRFLMGCQRKASRS